ncbi:MAG: sensor histidine kinase, partial [Pseudomonadota bacterium]
FSFQDEAQNGEDRVFALVPIIDGDVYALSSWKPGATFANDGLRVFIPIIFPLLMCAVSLLVAYFSISQLVIRPVNQLRREMSRFAAGERAEMELRMDQAPGEMRELAAAFDSLAKTIAADEVERAQALEDKTVLLREVYHRVKNNLQLIVSIMNMQIRNAHTPREKRLLQQLQERVMSLSIVHKNLYKVSALSSVRADELLDEIVNQLVGMGAQRPEGFRVLTEFDPITLYPDQAVPLSLLVTEAGTNAMKYTGRQDGTTWVKFSLHRDPDGMVDVEIANSKGVLLEKPDGSGLGTRLIGAFVNQLGGEQDVEESDDLYTLRVRFPLQTQATDTEDGTD